ncbi:MAG: hypothetical protein V1885_00335 [Candidatus Brennerbacteria bacterium]
MNRIIVLLAFVVAACAVTAEAQVLTSADSSYLEQFRGKLYREIVPKVWLDVCALNRAQYPDSNLVSVGDTIALPVGKQYVAGLEEGNHMWQASGYFTDMVVMPYVLSEVGTSFEEIVRVAQQPSERSALRARALLFALSIIALLVAAILWLDWSVKRRRPFATMQPTFRGGSDEQVRSAAERALTGTFGRGFEIVGPIERGVINGRQTVFFASGRHENETFRGEPGYRARLRFQDGSEALVVSRWSCFNPVWSAEGVRFRGTFTPQGGRPEEIPVISTAQANHLGGAIREVVSGREPATPASMFVPDRQPAPIPANPRPSGTPSAPTSEEPKQDGKLLKLTKVQFSRDKGLNLEGDIPISIEDLNALITKVQGETKDPKSGS